MTAVTALAVLQRRRLGREHGHEVGDAWAVGGELLGEERRQLRLFAFLGREDVQEGRAGLVHVTAIAGVGRIGVIAVVTGIAVVRNRNMRSCERINGIVVKRGRHPGCF